LLIISAAASSPAGQSSQSGTRLTGAAGDEPEDVPVTAAGAGVGALIVIALGLNGTAAGAASTKLSSKARRGGSIMTVTRALPEPNATGAARFRGVDIDGSGATRRFHRRASAIPDARAA
jgi:hypothetical protein